MPPPLGADVLGASSSTDAPDIRPQRSRPRAPGLRPSPLYERSWVGGIRGCVQGGGVPAPALSAARCWLSLTVQGVLLGCT